ncbi:FAT domain-containing protein [Melanogaster broomeanus]|nr:FAT domain-containing protein [Melanogaster broomeanus]
MSRHCYSRGGSTHRAWQTLPRHLRRRAASHDVRRVPVRLREKARAEMDPMRRKVLGRPKRGKANQISRTEALLKRQRDKTWLETHIWHAKRAKMENMWGYRLAATPTEKAFRPSHHASESKAKDPEAHAEIEIADLRGSINAFEVMGPKSSQVIKGALSPAGGEDRVDFKKFWESLNDLQTPSNIRRGMMVLQAWRERLPNLQDDISIWSDLVAWRQNVFNAINKAYIPLISNNNQNGNAASTNVNTSGYRGYHETAWIINRFAHVARKHDLLDVCFSSLNKIYTLPNIEISEAFLKLREQARCHYQKPNDLQAAKFPRKNAKPHYPDPTHPSNHPPPAFIFPTALIARAKSGTRANAEGSKGPSTRRRISTKGVQRCDSPPSLLLPLIHILLIHMLNPIRQGDRTPVLLIQRSLDSCLPSSASTSTSTNTHRILIYTGTRFAGQRERAKQLFDAGVPGFPMDHPTTPAYHVATSERAAKDAARWERTPPAKKPNYEKLGTRSPWCADWDVVLGLKTLPASGSGEGEEGLGYPKLN